MSFMLLPIFESSLSHIATTAIPQYFCKPCVKFFPYYPAPNTTAFMPFLFILPYLHILSVIFHSLLNLLYKNLFQYYISQSFLNFLGNPSIYQFKAFSFNNPIFGERNVCPIERIAFCDMSARRLFTLKKAIAPGNDSYNYKYSLPPYNLMIFSKNSILYIVKFP